jgi:hypothetical protein
MKCAFQVSMILGRALRFDAESAATLLQYMLQACQLFLDAGARSRNKSDPTPPWEQRPACTLSLDGA